MLWWLAQNGLAAGVLAGLVVLITRLGRLGPATRHALWLIVLLKLVTPPVIVWPWALPTFGEESPAGLSVGAHRATAEEQSLTTLLRVEAIENEPPSATEEFAVPVLSLSDPEDEASINNPVARTGPRQTAWIYALFQNLWLAGTMIMCLLQLLHIARFQRLLARSESAPRWLDNLVAEVADRIGVDRPRTLVVPGIGSPSVWSLGRPKLLWPASLMEGLPRPYYRSVIAHELAHLRRRDHWIGWLELMAQCVWWWNPVFWYVRRQLRFDAELACDAWVVATLPGDRRAYAEALIEVTELLSQTAAPMPALGIRSTARQDFERRLTMIMRDRTPCRVPVMGLLAIGVLALASLPGWSQPTVQVQKASDGKDVSGPEKPIIVTLPSDRDHQDAKHVIRLVEENAGDNVILRVIKDVDYQDAKHVIGLVQKTTGDKAVDVKSDATADRDSRLDKLERQLQELLKEVHALRAGGSDRKLFRTEGGWKTGEPADRPSFRIIEEKSDAAKHAPGDTAPAPKSGAIRYDKVPPSDPYRYQLGRPQDGKTTAGAVTLMRTTYRLPHARAEALAALLAEHKGGDILETSVDGDSLTVTTTPEAQRAINDFMGFLERMGTRTQLKVR